MAAYDSSERRASATSGNSAAPAWPRMGTSLEDIIAAADFKVFMDASFVKSVGFVRFALAWNKLRSQRFPTCYYYIPAYEMAKLSDREKTLLNPADGRELRCTDAADCFALLKKKGLNWNILWLTKSNQIGMEMQIAARKSGIPLRWYDMDAKCCLAPLPVGADRPAASDQSAKQKQSRISVPVTKPVTITRVANAPVSVPNTGEPVSAPTLGLRIGLREPVMTDHSSITYKTDNRSYFAKIYTPRSLQADLFEKKARHMLSMDVQIEGVCWPKDVLLNRNGDFVGILVPASGGVQLSRTVFGGASAIEQHFRTWDKRDLCALARKLLSTIDKLHKAGVLFGCFNPASVYITSAEKVFFVDTDTWQIGPYPVISRNTTFTPPELLNQGKGIHLYTKDEENYQMALLTFMIMMPGKYPYAKRNSSSNDENLQNRAFPFSIGGDLRRSEDAERPSGPWQIAWDHLPYRMCYNFYHTFHPKGDYAAAGKRLELAEWLKQVEQFEAHLQTAAGAASRALFPRTFRRDGKRTFVKCQICGQEHPSFYFLRKIRVQGETVNIWDKGYRVCLPCAVDQSADPKAQFTCKHCKRTFYYTNRAKIMHDIGKADFDWNTQKWCKACKNTPATCERCGQTFSVTQQRVFYDRVHNREWKVCRDCYDGMLYEVKQRKSGFNSRR